RGGAEEVAVLEEIGLLARGVPALPGADDPPLHVDQVGLRPVQRRDQGVALEGLRVVELEAELGGGDLLRRRRVALLRRRDVVGRRHDRDGGGRQCQGGHRDGGAGAAADLLRAQPHGGNSCPTIRLARYLSSGSSTSMAGYGSR